MSVLSDNPSRFFRINPFMASRMEGESHGPVVQETINQLKISILQGRFVPGQRLVEADLMRELGVGRDSIRNALRHLVAEGVVTLQAYKGASVRKVTRRDLVEIFGKSGIFCRWAWRVGQPSQSMCCPEG